MGVSACFTIAGDPRHLTNINKIYAEVGTVANKCTPTFPLKRKKVSMTVKT
jgi:hypothetical protein